MFIPAYILDYWNTNEVSEELFTSIRALYAKLDKGEPEVSIVMPAYNEEDNIVKTLLSLCSNQTGRSVEIIVVNNNSTDKTESFIRSCGVHYVLETTQGITPARNAGLAQARGKYILNADADTIYPVTWIDEMIAPLERDADVCLTYGKFSFIPIGATGRRTLFFYEYGADFMRAVNKYIKDEAVNVYGFNSGFRREQGVQVDGFHHPPGTNEDGWLALKLRDKGFGKLYHVTKTKAIVWTTDRRIQIDGGLIKGSIKRLKRMLHLG